MCTKALLFALILCAVSAVIWAAEPVVKVNVRDFGAKGDGTTDDSDAFLAAINALTPESDTYRGVNTIVVPAGQYLISKTLNLPHRTTITSENPRYHQSDASIIIAKNDFVPIKLNQECGVIGLSFYYSNNQSVKNPQVYPPCIELNGSSPVIEKCQFSGAWICISTPDSGANAPGLFKEINGWFHHIGIRMDGGLDIARFEDIHWFVGGTDRDNVAETHYFKERVGFQFGRQDGVMMSNCFIIHGKALLEMLPVTAAGRTNHSLKYLISSCWCENVDYAFIFDGMFGAAISDCEILLKHFGTGIKINNVGSFYNLTVQNTTFRGYGKLTGIDYTAADERTQNRLVVSGCQFAEGLPAIKLNDKSRHITISGNHFMGQCDDEHPIISIGKDSSAIVIKDNFVSVNNNKWLVNNAKGEKTIVIKDNQIEY